MTGRWTWHGGGLSAAQARFGGTRWIDLSTGINPHAYPADAAIDWRHLPDEAGLDALEAAAAAHFGVDPAHVCAVPGTELALRLAGTILPGPAAWPRESYGSYAEIFAPGTGDPATTILANPNNPDGALLDPDALDRPGWILLDEAFADVTPGFSGLVSDSRRLLVFRSFGKFFGLAGLRLGFVLGPRETLAAFRARLGAWPVSAAAIAIGTAAYRDTGWIADMRDRLPADAAALDARLREIDLSPRGDCPLFRLIEMPGAGALFTRLCERAILTRPFAYRPDWLRIGLPADDEARDRLIDALRGG